MEPNFETEGDVRVGAFRSGLERQALRF